MTLYHYTNEIILCINELTGMTSIKVLEQQQRQKRVIVSDNGVLDYMYKSAYFRECVMRITCIKVLREMGYANNLILKVLREMGLSHTHAHTKHTRIIGQ